MGRPTSSPTNRQVVEGLSEAGVDFVLVGPEALNLHALKTNAVVIDIMVRTDDQNTRKVTEVLRSRFGYNPQPLATETGAVFVSPHLPMVAVHARVPTVSNFDEANRVAVDARYPGTGPAPSIKVLDLPALRNQLAATPEFPPAALREVDRTLAHKRLVIEMEPFEREIRTLRDRDDAIAHYQRVGPAAFGIEPHHPDYLPFLQGIPAVVDTIRRSQQWSHNRGEGYSR